MKKAFFLFLLIVISFGLFSQSSDENNVVPKIKYSNITEFGFVSVNPKGAGFEGTSVSGISINDRHSIGIGYGYGGLYENQNNADFGGMYMPVFVNYRYYFFVKKFSPHINVSAGGRFFDENTGIFATLTTGFKAGHFSFSSGINFMAVKAPHYSYYDSGTMSYWSEKWIFPVGISIKVGFCF